MGQFHGGVSVSFDSNDLMSFSGIFSWPVHGQRPAVCPARTDLKLLSALGPEIHYEKLRKAAQENQKLRFGRTISLDKANKHEIK